MCVGGPEEYGEGGDDSRTGEGEDDQQVGEQAVALAGLANGIKDDGVWCAFCALYGVGVIVLAVFCISGLYHKPPVNMQCVVGRFGTRAARRDAAPAFGRTEGKLYSPYPLQLRTIEDVAWLHCLGESGEQGIRERAAGRCGARWFDRLLTRQGQEGFRRGGRA